MKFNYATRIIIAIVVGLVAGFVNFAYLASQKKQAPQYWEFLYYKSDVKTGDVVDKNVLDVVQIPAEFANVYSSLFLGRGDYGMIAGLKATRPCVQGTLVQRADFDITNDAPEYRILGPFRLIALGSQFTRDAAPDQGSGSGSGAGYTVAVKHETARGVKADKSRLDKKARRLLQLLSANPRTQPDMKIVAVVAYPEERSANAPAATDASTAPASASASTNRGSLSWGLAEDETAIFVPTPNVPTAPGVIMSLDAPTIGFVVPAAAFPSDELEEYADGI